MKPNDFKKLLKQLSGTDSIEEFDARITAQQRARNLEIKNAILVLAAAVIRCDNNYASSTEKYVDDFIVRHFEKSEKTVKVVADHVFAGTEPYTKIACTELNLLSTYESRITILKFLFGVAASDDFINAKEVRAIHRFAKYMGINETDFTSIKNDFIALHNPYVVLGLDESATMDEVKSAYRKLTLKFHPDKSKNDKAHENYMNIKKAYQTIIARINTF